MRQGRLGPIECFVASDDCVREDWRFATGQAGEGFLEELYERYCGSASQIWFPTPRWLGKGRFVDITADGVIHESKVGYVRNSARVRTQIEKDRWLVANRSDVVAAMWHFLPSLRSSSIGPAEAVRRFLEAAGIVIVIHSPIK